MNDYVKTEAAHQPEGAHHDHVMPVRLLVIVYAALLFLTVLTYAVTFVDLGGMNLWIALGVAVCKGGLVALFFMHLKYDAPFNGFVIVLALVLVALFIGLALMDSLEYQPNFQTPLIVYNP